VETGHQGAHRDRGATVPQIGRGANLAIHMDDLRLDDLRRGRPITRHAQTPLTGAEACGVSRSLSRAEIGSVPEYDPRRILVRDACRKSLVY
jgi:hypothetical protein